MRYLFGEKGDNKTQSQSVGGGRSISKTEWFSGCTITGRLFCFSVVFCVRKVDIVKKQGAAHVFLRAAPCFLSFIYMECTLSPC